MLILIALVKDADRCDLRDAIDPPFGRKNNNVLDDEVNKNHQSRFEYLLEQLNKILSMRK